MGGKWSAAARRGECRNIEKATVSEKAYGSGATGERPASQAVLVVAVGLMGQEPCQSGNECGAGLDRGLPCTIRACGLCNYCTLVRMGSQNGRLCVAMTMFR